MPRLCGSHHLTLFTALWILGPLGPLHAWTGIAGRKPKDQLDPNVKDWGDYSDLPPGIEHGLGLKGDAEREDGVGAGGSTNLAPELDFLSEFAGKNRLWVITAPSHNDHYLRMMEKQLEDMDQKGLNCRLAERDTFIITIIQNAMMEGRIQKTTPQGDATMENLDPDTVSRLLHYLELSNQEQAFTMMVIKKNLRVSERFPYPVRVEAVLETIDQFPVRKLEKIARHGSTIRCKSTKKKVVMKRKKVLKKLVSGPNMTRNITSGMILPSKLPMNKKAALRNKVQDILNGRSRFVIRKESSGSAIEKGSNGNDWDSTEGMNASPSTRRSKEIFKDKPPSVVEEAHKNQQPEQELNLAANVEAQDKQSSKKKGKKKKGKKGKGRGKKSSREASEEDKAALKKFLDTLRGSRRLMLVSTPSRDAALYFQMRAENEKHVCALAVRKITEVTIIGQGTESVVTLQHHQLKSEPPLSDQSKKLFNANVIFLLRQELGLSSPDLFSMTVTDYDTEPKTVFEAPPSSLALFEYIDGFPSRQLEKERERKSPPVCSADVPEPVQNSLLRFMSKRRLLLISAPSEDDYSYQQQRSALTGQECYLGIRHFALLKLFGTGEKASGTVELFPLNGRSQSEVEPLSSDSIKNLREQLKISEDYFSMLVVGKDGDVKAWFPSPLWTLDSVYDLVDSMELRLQEEKLQKSLGIHCSEDGGRTDRGSGPYAGYDEDRDRQ